jgi:hypothetical protein
MTNSANARQHAISPNSTALAASVAVSFRIMVTVRSLRVALVWQQKARPCCRRPGDVGGDTWENRLPSRMMLRECDRTLKQHARLATDGRGGFGRRRVFSLAFPAGVVVLFIHWRVAAERRGGAGDLAIIGKTRRLLKTNCRQGNRTNSATLLGAASAPRLRGVSRAANRGE